MSAGFQTYDYPNIIMVHRTNCRYRHMRHGDSARAIRTDVEVDAPDVHQRHPIAPGVGNTLTAATVRTWTEADGWSADATAITVWPGSTWKPTESGILPASKVPSPARAPSRPRESSRCRTAPT